MKNSKVVRTFLCLLLVGCFCMVFPSISMAEEKPKECTIVKDKKGENKAHEIPQGGGYVKISEIEKGLIMLANGTGHKVNDIELTWCDPNGNKKNAPDGFKSFKSEDMNKAVVGADEDNPKNPISYKSLSSINPNKWFEVTFGLSRRSDKGDYVKITLSWDGDTLCMREETEPNDKLDEALSLDRGDYAGRIQTLYDQDWYFFTINDNSRANLIFTGSSMGANLSLYDQDGNLLAEKSGKDISIETDILNPGIYYVLVYADAPQSYSIKEILTVLDSEYFGPVYMGSEGIDVGETFSNGGEVVIPIRIQNAPNPIFSFGFELPYPADVLEFAGFERGDLITSFPMFNVYNLDGKVKIGGLDFGAGIAQGASGDLVLLKFNVNPDAVDGCSFLELQNCVDDIDGFSKSGGYFCKDTVAPEIVCPEDIVIQTYSNGISLDDPAILNFLSGATAFDNLDGEVAVDFHSTEGFTEKGVLKGGFAVSGRSGTVIEVVDPNDRTVARMTMLPGEPVSGAEVFADQSEDDVRSASLSPAVDDYGIREAGLKSALSNLIFPIGDSSIIFTATDRAGNTATCISTITVERICTGDQDGDGMITPADALNVFMCYVGSGDCNDCSDVNGDGMVTPADALCLFRNYLGQPSCLD